MSGVRRLSATARFAVIRESISAHVGKIADSVEGAGGYDPSGLLVSATDTADGVAVSLGVGAGVATPTPATALGWSVPLRDASGRPITEVGNYALSGYARALAVANPTAFATPSNLYCFVGIMSDGPLSTATAGIVYGLRNDAASAWRCVYIYRTTPAPGTWATNAAVGTSPGTTGAFGGWAEGHISPGNLFGAGVAAIPGPPDSANSRRDLVGINFGPGSDPHLVFGFGWSGTPSGPDSMTARLEVMVLPAFTA